MDVLLIPGLWLDGSVWDPVVTALADLGHRAAAITLPGQGDGSDAATLDDQVAAVLSAVDAADGPVLVVGHSAASTLAWIAADRRPEAVATVAMIGGFPGGDGTQYFDGFEPQDGFVRFPGWEPFEGPDSVDLDTATRDRIAAGAVPVPAAVTSATVQLNDERRYDVPVVLVCPEFTPDDARGWLAAGHLPELARVRNLTYVDLDSGHWPMVSCPRALARVLAHVAAAAAV